ncbi:putative apoptosis inhibitor ORF99 [Nymphon striatum]|nr:putative apoptosis inhibitor ORF99 [Nymphon striatum]
MVLLPYDEYLDKYDEKVREPIAPYDPKNVDYSKKFKKIKQENLPPDIEYKLTSGVISSLAKGNNNKPVARSLSDDVILLSIPPVYINRGRNLLLFLKQNGFKWDSLGLITEPITGGNIVDILKHVVIKTKKNKTPPDGWNAYANYMREAPTDFRPDATTPSEINLRGRWISRFKRKLVLEWMEKQPSYTLHRQVKKRYKTSQVKVPGINHQFQADLMDVSNLSKYNDNYKFILTVIDCFSRLHVTYKMDPIFEAYRQPSLQLGGGYIPVYQGGAGVLSDIWRFTKPIIHRLARPALGLAADILVKKKSPKAALKRTLINETIQEKSVVVDIHPISAQSGSAPIEFFIPGDGQYYIDLNDTILALDVKLNKPVATEKTAPVNQLISSLFSNLELTLNDTQVEGGSHLYSYKSYFNTLLQYGKDAKETHLRNYGFYKDEPKKFDDITGDGNAKRLAYQGKTMYLNGAIFADIFHQPRYLLPHVNVRLRFTRQPEKFSLVNFTDTVIETNITITKAIMYVRKVRVSPSVGLAHEEAENLYAQEKKFYLNADILPYDAAKYPHYALESRRKKSFPEDKKINIDYDLWKYGFFYAGWGDVVICFYCGLILTGWRKTDIPFVEHKKVDSNCLYLKLNHGVEECKICYDSEADIMLYPCLHILVKLYLKILYLKMEILRRLKMYCNCETILTCYGLMPYVIDEKDNAVLRVKNTIPLIVALEKAAGKVSFMNVTLKENHILQIFMLLKELTSSPPEISAYQLFSINQKLFMTFAYWACNLQIARN